MTCDFCNAATKIVDSTPAKDEGRFKEEYECANGHRGWVTGKEEAPPKTWDRYGSVFEE